MARPMGVTKVGNEYARQLGDLYRVTPKAVLGALAVSALTNGGDHLDEAADLVLAEWWILYRQGIVPQKPPREIEEGVL